MPYSEMLADRIRKVLPSRDGLEEKKMFGGIGFLIGGNMAVGVMKDSLIVRFDPSETQAVLREPHVKEFDFTGRAMKGWAVVGPEGVREDGALAEWVRRSAAYAAKLPAK